MRLLRYLRAFRTRKRFERLFVRPFAEPMARRRAARKGGVKELRDCQRQYLHAALARIPNIAVKIGEGAR